RILEHITPLPASRRPLRDSLDRVLAEDVSSPIDLPAWDNSAMDGYAARAADIERGKVTLAVVETVAAGQFPKKSIGPGEVTRISGWPAIRRTASASGCPPRGGRTFSSRPRG